MNSIVWISVISGVIVLGGAHLAVWAFLRAQRRSEAADAGKEAQP